MHIEVEGYKEFQRDLKQAMGKLPKSLGEAHRNVGKFVIDNLEPRPDTAAVGAGAGAKVRASATKREVLLRAGYGGRTHTPMQQWGKRDVTPFRSGTPPRPYILKTALDREQEVRELLLDELEKALKPAFHS